MESDWRSSSNKVCRNSSSMSFVGIELTRTDNELGENWSEWFDSVINVGESDCVAVKSLWLDELMKRWISIKKRNLK